MSCLQIIRKNNEYVIRYIIWYDVRTRKMGLCCIPSNFFSNLCIHIKLKNNSIIIIKYPVLKPKMWNKKTFGYFNLTLKNRIWSHSFLRLMHKSTACKMASMLHHVTCYCLVIFFTCRIEIITNLGLVGSNTHHLN